MESEQLTNFIIKELSRQTTRQNLVSKLCERTTLSWGEAEALIKDVEAQHRRKIATRQSPLLVFLSIGTLLLGLGLLIYNIEFFIHLFQGSTVEQLLIVRRGYYMLVQIATGLGMTAGGLYGLWQTLAALLPD